CSSDVCSSDLDRARVVGQLSEPPPGHDFLERSVEHPGGKPRIHLRPERSLFLAAADDPLETGEGLPDLVELVLDMRAACDLAHEQAYEVGIVAPGAQDDLDHELELLGCALPRVLCDRHGRQQPTPLFAKDGFEDGLL